MKTTHIIVLIAIAAAVAVLVSASSDLGTYEDFKTAIENPGESHQIVGQLVPGKPIDYNPSVNPNKFSFWLKDNNGMEKQVVYNGPKPQDFERSEQVVLTGQLNGESFVATDLLLKCPSKYNQESVKFSVR